MLSCNTWKIQSLFMFLQLMIFQQYCLLVIYNCCINFFYCYTNNGGPREQHQRQKRFPCACSVKTPCSSEYFSVLPYSRLFHSWSSALIFWTLKYSSFKQQKGRKIDKLMCLGVRTDVRTFGVCLQQRSSKATWNYTWNLTLRRSVNFDCP